MIQDKEVHALCDQVEREMFDEQLESERDPLSAMRGAYIALRFTICFLLMFWAAAVLAGFFQ